VREAPLRGPERAARAAYPGLAGLLRSPRILRTDS